MQGDQSDADSKHYKKALLVIDMQNDFWDGKDKNGDQINHPGSIAIEGSHMIIDRVNKLCQDGEFDLIFKTRDCHPPDHVSFAETHKKQPQTEILVKETNLTQMLWPKHCVKDDWGYEYIEGLEVESGNARVVEILKG